MPVNPELTRITIEKLITYPFGIGVVRPSDVGVAPRIFGKNLDEMIYENLVTTATSDDLYLPSPLFEVRLQNDDDGVELSVTEVGKEFFYDYPSYRQYRITSGQRRYLRKLLTSK